MQPLDPEAHYGIADRNYLDLQKAQMELLPDKLHELRWKLNQKAKKEPKFRFYALYDRICREDVLGAAWKHVGKRKKAAGIDGVRAEDILGEEKGVENFLAQIREELQTKSYRPSPVRRVFIPKADGKKRPLGIPTLKDRVVQMAVVLILEPIFEADFHECSHGFRPGRKAHDALEAIRENLKAGRTEVYDADLKGYFDSIPHDKLMACVRMRVVDGSVLRLIEQWLKAPVEERESNGRITRKRNGQGTPQGGVISPLLANIYLHWFDKVFHAKDGPARWAKAVLVRYADDFVVMTPCTGKDIRGFIEEKIEGWLGLKINREKTRVVKLRESGEMLDFLGYSFRLDRSLYGADKPPYWNMHPSKKSLAREREKLRGMISRRRCHQRLPEMIAQINRHLKGWANYYRPGYSRCAFRQINRFVRERLTRYLRRGSQRAWRPAEGVSIDAHINNLGLIKL
jgi:RNA-directed DNA polymerase